MFQYLAHFKKILVTGPQRSGTTIAAKMIAEDTRKDFYEEERIGIDNIASLENLLKSNSSFILQCPGISYDVHNLAYGNNIAVVFMIRAIEDIQKSQRRIGWAFEPIELKKYQEQRGPIAKVKYAFWYSHQKRLIKHAFDVEYNTLSKHPLWIPADKRENFGPRQIK